MPAAEPGEARAAGLERELVTAQAAGAEREGALAREPVAARAARPEREEAGGGGGGGIWRHTDIQQEDLTTCAPGQVWDRKKHKCLQRHSSVLPDPELTEYAYALAKSERDQEALNVLDTLENPNTPRALNCRGYAKRKLGRTDEGITYYLKSVALDPNYPQVREYLGQA